MDLLGPPGICKLPAGAVYVAAARLPHGGVHVSCTQALLPLGKRALRNGPVGRFRYIVEHDDVHMAENALAEGRERFKVLARIVDSLYERVFVSTSA